ncbi:MAG: LacI family DNA-binding transcriptional regulator [Desulfovibrionaceae bacterium]|nr:LacI family DNA-binding transcriptional regulator [Desulfovibrionaceae bacterium]
MGIKLHLSQAPVVRRADRRSLKRMTIKDVAKMAGVSLMTVSRVINSPDRVSSKKLDAVHLAIKKTGYIHNRLAGGLSGSRTGQVAVLVPSLSNLVFSDLLNGVASVLEPKQIQMMVGNYHYMQKKLEEQIPLFLEWSPDAMVIVGPVPRPLCPLLRKNGIPVVETVELVVPPFDCNVGISHEAAGYAMAEYLTGLGYSRMGAISANAGLEKRTAQRISGFRRYLAENGFDVPVEVALEGRSSIAEGKKAMCMMLAAPHRPEAVFCANDDLAFGAMTACLEAGLHVPDDMGIAGFNALDIALQCIPSITTVKVDRFGMGELAAHMLLERLSGNKKPDGTSLDMGFSIVPGMSTCKKY